MFITYRDTLGIVRIDNVQAPVTFLDGIVYFSADFDDFELYTDQIIEIGE